MNDTGHNSPGAWRDALAQLPADLPPGRDLWPGIESRLEPRAGQQPGAGARRMRWPALAASVAFAFAAGLLLGRQGPGPAAAPTMAFNPGDPAVAVALRAAEQEYLAEWKGFTTVGVAPTLLTPQAQEELEASWNALLQAETALLTALDEHPDNPYLGEKLLDLRGQQLDFMRQLHMLDQNSRRDT
ncbi:hypothetical protein F3N42_15355 [Marinihelvus fidelis]|uniref:Uncharacterized protein n=1 Tax=Marinihelvus fidelis TaxID=2613842 RepID=A0A5N0T3B8_9GAMM|nr:hypothetical protein [Marinihelvus fidelis]KAA9129570.1 hypothetical protein F3N42_15355 [Marinihelvus fidelis]